ncbi:MAG TPA: hypothetical protein VGJ73_16020 [Verrucomicrobiae bacterium]
MDQQKYLEVVVRYLKLKKQVIMHYANKAPQDVMKDLQKLNDDVKTLGDTWSAMAEVNLLSDVLRDIKKIESRPQMPPGVKATCVEAIQKIGSFIKGCNVTNARYDSVLCVGYRIKVGATNDTKYSGKSDDWQDMKARCERLKKAIRSAYNLTARYNNNDRILKIFMAPEFYFRGKNGAYDHDVIGGIKAKKKWVFHFGGQKGLMDLMAEEVDKVIYNHWLFVMGTAIAATKENRTVCKTCGGELKYYDDVHKPGKTRPVCKKFPGSHSGTKDAYVGASIDNVAIIRKEKQDYIVSKELISDIDFIKEKTATVDVRNVVTVRGEDLNVLRTPQASGYNTASAQPSKFTDERMGGSVFTIDGVTFGMEVCLDHAASVSSQNTGRLESAANIQVQLIPSAGMGITNFRAVPGGVIFNVDGLTPHVEVRGMGASRLGNPLYEARVNRGGAREDLATEGLGGWSPWRSVAPKIASAADGAVLMYGPYTLPSTMPF